MAYNDSFKITGNLSLGSLYDSEATTSSAANNSGDNIYEDIVHFHHYEGASQTSFTYKKLPSVGENTFSETENSCILSSSMTSTSSEASVSSEDNVYQCMRGHEVRTTLGATSKIFCDDGYFCDTKNHPLNDLRYCISEGGGRHPALAESDHQDTDSEDDVYQLMADLDIGATSAADTYKDFYDSDCISKNYHFNDLTQYISEIESIYPDSLELDQPDTNFSSKSSEKSNNQESSSYTLDINCHLLLKSSSPIEIPNKNRSSKIIIEGDQNYCESDFIKIIQENEKNTTSNTHTIDFDTKLTQIIKPMKFIKSMSSPFKKTSRDKESSPLSPKSNIDMPLASSFSSLYTSVSCENASESMLSSYNLSETDFYSRTKRKNKLLSRGITEFIIDSNIKRFTCFSKATPCPIISKNLSIVESRVRKLFPDCDKNVLDEIVALTRFILRKGFEESEKFLKKCRKKYVDKFDKNKFLLHSTDKENELEMSQRILDTLFTEDDMNYISCYAKAFVSLSYNKYKNDVFILLNMITSSNYHMEANIIDVEIDKSNNENTIGTLERKLNHNLLLKMDVVFNIVLGYKYRKDESFKKAIINIFEMNLEYV